MVEFIYRKDNLNLTYDINEDTYYISVDGEYITYCTKDYTKEEIISILKDMVKVLEEWYSFYI